MRTAHCGNWTADGGVFVAHDSGLRVYGADLHVRAELTSRARSSSGRAPESRIPPSRAAPRAARGPAWCDCGGSRSACLTAEQRSELLEESPALARDRATACERENGR
jgi:hypothetical protein